MRKIISIMICLIVLPLSGCVLVNPTTLDLASTETTKTFTLTVIGDIKWSINYSENWLTVEPDNGQGTTTITVTVDRTGLDDGSHEATLYISTNPNMPCPDVIVKMTVGEVTTSTTTSIPAGTTTTTSPSTSTTAPRDPPDPVVNENYHFKGRFYIDDVCEGALLLLEVENRGGAGEVYCKATISARGYTDCVVAFMGKGETRKIGPLHFFDKSYCTPPTYIEYDIESRASLPTDYSACKKPPDPEIRSPRNYSKYVTGENILFEEGLFETGDIVSYDSVLPESAFVWTSDIDGQIGTGISFTRDDLSVGIHTITLSVTDSKGDTGTESVKISIDDAKRKVWEFEADDNIYTSPTVSNGKVYFGNGDKMYCIDANTGSKVWEYEPTEGYHYFNSSPAVSDGNVYVVSSYSLCCLNAQTGNKVWEFEDLWIDNTSPAVSGGYVYVGGSYKFYCLNAQTGDKIWEFQEGVNERMEDTPAVSDGHVYVGSSEGKLYCLDAQTGNKVWEFGLERGSPAIKDGKVYLGVYCLDAKTGNTVWKSEVNTSGSSTVVLGGYVYTGNYCLDAKTGDEIWLWPDGALGDSVFSDNYAYTLQDNLQCLDAKTGIKVWEYISDDYWYGSLALSGGYIYTTNDFDRTIYCLKAAEGDTGSWPMFKGNPARTGAR